ncbi:MAG: putative bifunctional diguanylate cyclase/phosphodiesterase, partial [Gammaproteobacteria bacterium]
AAMYRGKSEGRNTIFFFDPSVLSAAEERLRLETALRTAIERRELSLYYQPQVDAAGRVIGAEALLRWQHPTLGTISPAQFIPIAEDSGIIEDIGTWAIEEALEALARWDAAGVRAGSHLAVNVSQRQFRSPQFVPQVIAALGRTALARGRLVFELTESTAMERVEETLSRMNLLREAGVEFSIDDFGVGYSSLAYLARLPLQQLKIDRSFIIGLTEGSSTTAIVAALLTLGTHMNLAVVAEGIETPEQLQRLVAHGCTKFQGYWFSRPLPEAEFIQYCKAPRCPATRG